MNTLLSIENLHINFNTLKNNIKVVNGVSLDVKRGEVLSIVGESGSGKSTVCKSIMGILPKNAFIESGSIEFEGVDLIHRYDENVMCDNNSLRRKNNNIEKTKITNKIRTEDISIVFQNPASYLDPTLTVGSQIIEGILISNKLSKREAKRRAVELIGDVGIDNPKERFKQYPHQLSGGMLQRIAIAMAISNKPKLIIADEPTTSLDTIVQKQIVTLLLEIQKKYYTSIIFVTHDLRLAKSISNRIAVMYRGEILEVGNCKDIYENPSSLYTKDLLNSLKKIDF